MTAARLVLTALLLLGASGTAFGQRKLGPHGEVEIGFTQFTGNTSQILLTSRLAGSFIDSTKEIKLGGGLNYGEVEDKGVSRRDGFTEGSLDLYPLAQFSPFGSARWEFATQKGINGRFSTGLGLKGKVFRSKLAEMSFSSAVLYEQSRLRAARVSGRMRPDTTVRLARLSNRLRYKQTLFKDNRVIFQHEMFYTPNLADFGNYLVTSQTSLTVALVRRVSLRISFSDDYDSTAGQRNAKPNDTKFLTSIIASL